jgi:hypothetical protein
MALFLFKTQGGVLNKNGTMDNVRKHNISIKCPDAA